MLLSFSLSWSVGGCRLWAKPLEWISISWFPHSKLCVHSSHSTASFDQIGVSLQEESIGHRTWMSTTLPTPTRWTWFSSKTRLVILLGHAVPRPALRTGDFQRWEFYYYFYTFNNFSTCCTPTAVKFWSMSMIESRMCLGEESTCPVVLVQNILRQAIVRYSFGCPEFQNQFSP